jgi:hypothetical protein
MLPRADDNRQVNASRKRMHKKKRRRRKRGKTTQQATIAGNKRYFTLSLTRGLAKLEEEESITKVKEVDK